MRTFWRILACLTAAIALSLFVFLAKPDWFITARGVSGALRLLGRSYDPHWSEFSFAIRSNGLLNKEIELRVSDFCFKERRGALAGCLDELDARVEIRISPRPRIVRIVRFILKGNHLIIDNTKAQARDKKKSSAQPLSLPSLLPEALRGSTVGAFHIHLPANEIRQASATVKADLSLALDRSWKKPLALKADIRRISGARTSRTKAFAFLDSDFLSSGRLTFIEAQGHLSQDGAARAKFQVRIAQKGESAVLKLKASAENAGRQVSADLSGSQTKERYVLDGSLLLTASSGPVKRVALRPFTLNAERKGASTQPNRLRLACRFEAEPGSFGSGKRRNPFKTIVGRAFLDLKSTPTTMAKDHFDAELEAAIGPLKDWYEFAGNLRAKISGRSGDLQSARVDHRLDLSFKVPRFEDLVSVLSGTLYAIPAPLHVLKGPLTFLADSAGDARDDRQELNYRLDADLAAGRQRLNALVSGTLAASSILTPKRSFAHKTKVVLRDVALQLPRLDITALPKVAPDARITTTARRKAEKKEGARGSSVPVSLYVTTLKPVLLYSNLALTPIPIAIDLHADTPPPVLQGQIAIRAFRAAVFRREATIEHLTLIARPGSSALEIDGLVVYQAAQAKIYIRLLGSTAKPHVVFESDPPMQQKEIIALLIFGRTPNELDSDQETAVGNTQSALSSDAFGLASLYLFASTPIEYVGYDPAARAYTMRIRIPGGASLEVGSGMDQSKRVQLRKRLASHLAIQTEIIRSEEKGNAVTTFLEWFKRY